LLAAVLIATLLCGAGCLDTGPADEASYAVDDEGTLTISTPMPDVTETVLERLGNVTVSGVVFRNADADVLALLAEPDRPIAGIVYAPGTGVPAWAHRERAVRYAEARIAFMVVDIRGNDGETPGEPFDLQQDYRRFSAGEWPQYYQIISDLGAARQFLSTRTSVPIIAMGSSNGGRYAAVAAAADPAFAGYIGVSTSGFGRAGDRSAGDVRRFLLSIDPDACIGSIAPRPVWLFHSLADPVIPLAEGRSLFDRAAEPKQFITFDGGHGVNDEVDARVVAVCEQIYAPAGAMSSSLKVP
jgi:fermentation-respiration switch protein FrsA (DUF1100 family)